MMDTVCYVACVITPMVPIVHVYGRNSLPIEILMFNVKYLAMHKVKMHAGTASKLLYGFASLRAIIHSLNLVGYLPV